MEQLVDHYFDGLAETEEKRLGDAWTARLGLDPSPTSARRVHGETDDLLGEAWLAHCGME